LVLQPISNPSHIPPAKAITFFNAPANSTVDISSVTYYIYDKYNRYILLELEDIIIINYFITITIISIYFILLEYENIVDYEIMQQQYKQSLNLPRQSLSQQNVLKQYPLPHWHPLMLQLDLLVILQI
jgi:hypothetical protein